MMILAGTVINLLKVMTSHVSGLILCLKLVLFAVHVQKLKKNIGFAVNSRDPMSKLAPIVASNLLCINYVRNLLVANCQLIGAKLVEDTSWIITLVIYM